VRYFFLRVCLRLFNESLECPTPADASFVRTLRSCGRFVRADASFLRTLRSCGRFIHADATFAWTLISHS